MRDALTTRTIPHASGTAPANATADSRMPSSSSCQNTRARASTQRETNRDLVPPRQRARQGEARKVGARDRQQHRHQAQEHHERGAVPGAETRIARRERCHVQPLTEQRLPLGFRQRGRQRRRLNRRPAREQFRARRVDGHAARETPDHVFRSKRPGRGSPPADRLSANGTMMSEGPVGLKTQETVRRDADHRRRHSVDLDHLADAGTIAEDAPAKILADHDDRVV